MKKLLSIACLLTAFCLQTAGQTKAETIRDIRKQYAEAKKKIDQNGKNGQSPKDLRIVLNRLEDEEIWLYDMDAITFYFDERAAEGSVVTKHPYFITEQWSNHGHERYREVLLNPKNQQVMFCFMRGITDSGFVVESRYYYNDQGQCVEEKHKPENSWTDPSSEKEDAEHYLKLFGMLTYNGYFTPLDTDAKQKATTPKTERMKHIRTVYSEAKNKMAMNDEMDGSDDCHITIHDLGDDQPPRTSETRVYFNDDGIYFINNHTTSMMSDGYSEYLFEPKTQDLIFSYTKGTEEGQVYEWRYYFDENGKCIETKTNADEKDEGFYDKRAARDWQAIFQELTK